MEAEVRASAAFMAVRRLPAAADTVAAQVRASAAFMAVRRLPAAEASMEGASVAAHMVVAASVEAAGTVVPVMAVGRREAQ
jgi:hypothetical protein